jgi:hypothetical protein
VADPETDIHTPVTQVGTRKKLQNIISLVIMEQILKNRIETEQELILQTASDEAVSSESISEHDEDNVAADDNYNATGSQDKSLVETTTTMDFWWSQSCHWSSQWIEDTRGTPCE